MLSLMMFAPRLTQWALLNYGAQLTAPVMRCAQYRFSNERTVGPSSKPGSAEWSARRSLV